MMGERESIDTWAVTPRIATLALTDINARNRMTSFMDPIHTQCMFTNRTFTNFRHVVEISHWQSVRLPGMDQDENEVQQPGQSSASGQLSIKGWGKDNDSMPEVGGKGKAKM